MATINEVAAYAQVSRMTVSRVINNEGYVGAKTRERVEEAIRALNYKPNLLAKALVTKHSKVIAYVMVNISDPFHNVVEQAFESIAFRCRYTSMICAVDSQARQRDYTNMFEENCIGGVVFHHLAITQEQIKELTDVGIKCVLMDNEFDLPEVPSINTDNHAGGMLAVQHLYELGHRKIGCIHGPLEPYESDGPVPFEDTFQFQIWHQRTAGFKDGMAMYGLDSSVCYQCNGRTEIAEIDSQHIVEQILAQEDRVTALYCENDIIALAILKRLQERGVKVPEEVAIVGHDGLDLIKLLHPHVTTIEQPRYEMGCLAATMLIDQIEENETPENVLLKPKLQQGETT